MGLPGGQNALHTAHLPVFQHHLNAVGMGGAFW